MHVEIGRYKAVASRGSRVKFTIRGTCNRAGHREAIGSESIDRLLQSAIKSRDYRVTIRRSPDTRLSQVEQVLKTLRTMLVDADIREGPQVGARDCVPMMQRYARAIGTQTSTEAPDESQVRGVIKGSLAKFRDCYESQLVRRPQLGGTVGVHFLIQPDGHVFDVAVNENTVDSEVAHCVAGVTRSLVFPPPDTASPVVVTYPFAFRHTYAPRRVKNADRPDVSIQIGPYYASVTVGDEAQPRYFTRGLCPSGRQQNIEFSAIERLIWAGVRGHRTNVAVTLEESVASAWMSHVTDYLRTRKVTAQISTEAATENQPCPAWLPAQRKVAQTTTATATTTGTIATEWRGSLSKAEILASIKPNVRHIRACYEAYLFAHPDTSGMVMVRFRIGPDGRVARISLAEDTVGRGLSKCVRETMRGLRFPKPRGGGVVDVTYPFVFGVT